MDIDYKGGNCILITAKKTVMAVDPKLSDLGLNDQGQKATVQLLTQPRFGAAHSEDTLVIDGPGEYEVQNISIKGIAARAHIDAKTEPLRATIYRIDTDDLSMAILGHIEPELTDEQLEEIGVVDVLVVPVGGNGYTLDATGAIRLVRAIDPKAVIPTHYAENGVTYPVPQAELDIFLKEIGAPAEELSRVKLKAGALPETFMVYNLKRTS